MQLNRWRAAEGTAAGHRQYTKEKRNSPRRRSNCAGRSPRLPSDSLGVGRMMEMTAHAACSEEQPCRFSHLRALYHGNQE